MATIGFLGILVASLAVPQGNGEIQSAVLHGFTLGEDTVTISVSSCGCTREDDFSFMVERESGGVRRVTVLRLEPDFCEAVPIEVQFEYSRADAKLKGNRPVTVLNEFRTFDVFDPGCH